MRNEAKQKEYEISTAKDKEGNLAGLKNVYSREQKLVWEFSPGESALYLEAARDLSEESNLPIRVCHFLLKRLHGHISSARIFLQSSAPDLDVSRIPHMKEAVSLILDESYSDAIGIYSDFDADGVTSAAILKESLSHLGINPSCVYFPLRFRHGYGFHASAVEEMYEKGVRLIITADCGITGQKACQMAKNLGCKVIVTDHHRPVEGIPDADVVLDPFLPSWQNLDLSYLTGAGVAYLLSQAIFKAAGVGESIPKDFVHDLLTISIAGDGLALRGFNRAFVKSGTNLLAQGKRPGIRELLTLIRGDNLKGNWKHNGFSGGSSQGVSPLRPLDYERDVMFGIVPRINAAGRMSSAYKAYQLLMERDPEKAKVLSKELDDLNTIRRQEEDKILSDFSGIFPEDTCPGSSYVLLAANPGWHQGVIGIASARLREAHFRPALLLAGDGEIMKGSLRGIPGFNVPEILSQCKEFLASYGGHEGAGGLSIQRKNVERFFQKFKEVAKQRMTEMNLWPSITVDEVLSLKCLDQEFLDGLMSLSPFGQGNPLPCFLLPDASVERVRFLGKEQAHLEISVNDVGEEDAKEPSRRLIFFRGGRIARDVCFWGRCDILFSPKENQLVNGENHTLVVRDIRPAMDLCGQGYDGLFASWADRFSRPLILYTFSPHAARSLYAALSKMGKKVAVHFHGETGALAQESLLTLSSGGMVVSNAPSDLFSDKGALEKAVNDMAGLKIILLHNPLKEAQRAEIDELAKKGAAIEYAARDGEASAINRDFLQWFFCSYPKKATMEAIWRFITRMSQNDLVFPWELGKRWKEILDVAGLSEIEFGPYDKALALIESSISILEELGMVSFSVINKTFLLKIAKPLGPVSLSESKRYLEGKTLSEKVEGFR